MPVHLRSICLTCTSLIILGCTAVTALGACTDWEREAFLRKMGCSLQAIEAICAGPGPIPRTPYCGGTEPPPAGMGDWCQTPTGGCPLSALAPLASMCHCRTWGGSVHGWVAQKS
jgi:hypothetical protein